MKTQKLILILFLAMMIALFTACGGDEDDEVSTPDIAEDQEIVVPVIESESSKEKEISTQDESFAQGSAAASQSSETSAEESVTSSESSAAESSAAPSQPEISVPPVQERSSSQSSGSTSGSGSSSSAGSSTNSSSQTQQSQNNDERLYQGGEPQNGDVEYREGVRYQYVLGFGWVESSPGYDFYNQ